MTYDKVFNMKFSEVFPMLIKKAERKDRLKEEVYKVTSWLTGYSYEQLDEFLVSDCTYGFFFRNAPYYNEKSELITGTVCGIRVETIEDDLMKRIRQLDKLVDELAKGKPMDRILRG